MKLLVSKLCNFFGFNESNCAISIGDVICLIRLNIQYLIIFRVYIPLFSHTFSSLLCQSD